MSNMSYCRWRNTLIDLQDCYNNLHEKLDNNDKDERKAKLNLIQLCRTIADEAEDYDLLEDLTNNQ